MAWASRILGGGLVAVIAAVVAGCTTGQTLGLGRGPASDGLQTAQVADPAPPRLARSQVPEPGSAPAEPGRAGLALPTPDGKLLPSGNPVLAASATVLNPQQTAALLEGSKVRLMVRAWVNGRPIFEDEVLHSVGPYLAQISQMAEPQRSEKLAEMKGLVLDRMIDQEILYQDAIKRLEKFNPKALKKLREMVNRDFEKRLRKMRDAGVPEEALREYGPTAHLLMERDFISGQYAQNRVHGAVAAQVTLEVVQDYYETHKNEFKTVDKIHWQDVFIAVGPKHTTLADARRFAEDLLARCRQEGDLAKAQPHDDGDSKFRRGDGFGHVRGEVRPPELEKYLFELKDGEFGPAVELPTGVHIFRVTKREYAGIIPMTDAVQKQIRHKLEGQLAEREYKALVRDLRSVAVIQIVRDAP